MLAPIVDISKYISQVNKNAFLILIIVLLIGFSIYSEFRYYNLKQDYIELKYNDLHRIDSLNASIKENLQRVKILEKNIVILNSKIDSLEKIKKEIYKSPFTVSTSTEESIKQLKQNLEWRN